MLPRLIWEPFIEMSKTKLDFSLYFQDHAQWFTKFSLYTWNDASWNAQFNPIKLGKVSLNICEFLFFQTILSFSKQGQCSFFLWCIYNNVLSHRFIFFGQVICSTILLQTKRFGIPPKRVIFTILTKTLWLVIV